MVKCRQCRNVFRVIGEALNLRVETALMLEWAAKTLVDEFGLKACHFRLLSRDQRTLDHVASVGLSEGFLAKGPVDAELSIAEALAGEVVMVEDCSSDSRIQYPKAFVAEGISSLLTVPLETRGQVIGVMRLFTAEKRAFTDEELEFFTVAALFCTSAIVGSMFHQILGHVTDSIRSSLELSEVLEGVVKVVCEDLRAKGCAIQLLDPKTSILETRASDGLSLGFVGRIRDVFSRSAFVEVLAGGCVAIFDGRSDSRVARPEEMVQEGISSTLLVPLMRRGEASGVLSLFTHHPYSFSEDEQQLMAAIGEQCSLAIDNARMYEAVKQRYDNLVDEFHQWFEHSQTGPQRSSTA